MSPLHLRLLNFVIDYMDANEGVSPTFQEIAAGVGLASKSGVARILRILYFEEWLTWGGERNITILKRPPSRDPYHPNNLADLQRTSPTKFEQLALNIVTLQARRAAA